MLREELGKFSKEELVNAVMFLLEEDVEVQAYKAYINQANHIIKYCNEENLVENLSDKDDKRYDRGKSFFKDLPSIISEMKKMRMELLNIKERVQIIEDAEENGVVSFLQRKGMLK